MTGSAPFMQSSIRRMVASHSPSGRRLKSLASRTNFSVNFPVARNQQPIASAASNRNGVASDAAKKRKTLLNQFRGISQALLGVVHQVPHYP
jgi:hypothetical protein